MIALSKKTASKGIAAKCQWKDVIRRFLWKTHFFQAHDKIFSCHGLDPCNPKVVSLNSLPYSRGMPDNLHRKG